MASEGGNQIQVRSARADIKCWMYGSENGYGTIGTIRTYHSTQSNLESPYADYWFRDLNLLTCEIGLTPITGNQDVIIIPMRNQDTLAEGNTANANFATLSNIQLINPGANTVGDADTTIGTNNYVQLLGNDQFMHEVIHLTKGLTTDFVEQYPTGTPHFYTSDGTTNTGTSDSSATETGPGT